MRKLILVAVLIVLIYLFLLRDYEGAAEAVIVRRYQEAQQQETGDDYTSTLSSDDVEALLFGGNYAAHN